MQKSNSKNILISIGQLSQLLDVHQRTLRIYEYEKILIPKRSKGDRRLYSIDDIEKARLILFLTRNLALNLSGVKVIFEILNKIKLKPEKYTDFMSGVAKSAKIKQNENILKTSKRGRKSKTTKNKS